jgi:ribosomally synthesized peptide (two-chain TOMM family)
MNMSQPGATSIITMMQFRLAYLKAIAKAWNDAAFFKKMISDPDGWKCLGSPKVHWNLELRFAEDTLPGNGYRPSLTGGWVGPDAVMTLRLPNAPAEEQQSLALAAYYAEMSTPFGKAFKGRQDLAATFEAVDGGNGGDGSDGSDGDGLGHSNDAFVLGGVILRALALSWSSDEFRQQFFQGDALVALENWVGYNFPWNMQIKAKLDEELEWQAGSERWSRAPRNQLTLYVPNKPQTQHQAVALAAYNETGNAYPLTCP